MYKSDAPKCVRIHHCLLRLDVLIGTAGSWRSDWHKWEAGQSACRLLALAREVMDSTRAGASDHLQAAATSPSS